MGIKERKERDRQEMRARILEAALGLFVAEGYDAVTLRRIADTIEYSAATIYLYFKDKDDIFYALFRQGFELLLSRQIETQRIADPRERLIGHGRAYVDFAMENPRLYEIMFVIHAPLKAMAEEQDSRSTGASYDLLRRNVMDCMETGYFTGENPEAVAFTLWSLVHGVASLAIGGRLQMLPEQARMMLVQGAKDFMGRMLFPAFQTENTSTGAGIHRQRGSKAAQPE